MNDLVASFMLWNLTVFAIVLAFNGLDAWAKKSRKVDFITNVYHGNLKDTMILLIFTTGIWQAGCRLFPITLFKHSRKIIPCPPTSLYGPFSGMR